MNRSTPRHEQLVGFPITVDSDRRYVIPNRLQPESALRMTDCSRIFNAHEVVGLSPDQAAARLTSFFGSRDVKPRP